MVRYRILLRTNRATLLPVVTGIVKGKDGVKSQANVFLDSGAQICMIRNAFAESLALESKPVSIVITKVGGVEEELTTKLYEVPVYNNNEHRIQVIQAVGIAQISKGSPNGNLSEIAKIFNIPRHELHRNPGPVDLLVGINYPHFHAGETKVMKKLAVRRSPLRWVVFGAGTEDGTTENNQVLHVRLASPIDLTEF